MILKFKCFMDQSCIEQPIQKVLQNWMTKSLKMLKFFVDDVRFDQTATTSDAETDLRIAVAQNMYS